jgi:hypothetical protein
MAEMRLMVSSMKGSVTGPSARVAFDELMEKTPAADGLAPEHPFPRLRMRRRLVIGVLSRKALEKSRWRATLQEAASPLCCCRSHSPSRGTAPRCALLVRRCMAIWPGCRPFEFTRVTMKYYLTTRGDTANASKARETVQVHSWEGMTHVFPSSIALLHGANEALDDIGDFLRRQFLDEPGTAR